MTDIVTHLFEPGRWAALVQALDERTCDEIISRCSVLESAEPRVVGEDHLDAHRVGVVHRVDRTENTEEVYSLLWEAGDLVNAYHFELELTEIVKAPEYVEYQAGMGHFHWHNDYGLERPVSRRKLTVTMQLSDPVGYEGGDLEVSGASGPLPRERGTIIAFPAYVQHRVTPVTRGTRRALVGWLAGPPLR